MANLVVTYRSHFTITMDSLDELRIANRLRSSPLRQKSYYFGHAAAPLRCFWEREGYAGPDETFNTLSVKGGALFPELRKPCPSIHGTS